MSAHAARPAFVIKARVEDPRARTFVFTAAKTMYGGKHVAVDDTIFVIASEHDGGNGLVARGQVTAAIAVPKLPDRSRQTPRITLSIRRTALVRRPLGRTDLRTCTNWSDGEPATELNFKLYRQATNKLIAITPAAADFLDSFF